jgi:pimeloyl-ACP methyl ester carboxylesterase
MTGIGLRLAAVLTLASASLAGIAPPSATASPAARVAAVPVQSARLQSVPARTTPAQSTPPGDTTTAESALLAAVKTPKLRWRTCYDYYRCTTAKLPLDYDRPNGATVSIALVKRPADQPGRRIGSLFVNPGGPGGSGVDLALAADDFLGASVLDRFDVVGFDPRGIGESTEVRCWRTNKARVRAIKGFARIPFPWSRDDLPAYLDSAARLARACSGSTGKPLSASMSTAEVARDLELLRRAVGDDQLTYLGFSYGTFLGAVYANMFPDRVRALVIDGVLTPEGWAGTAATADTPVTLRIDSAGGAWKAWQRALELCGVAGPEYCAIGADPRGEFQDVLDALRQGPIPLGGGWEYSYAEFSADLLSALYYPDGAEFATWEVSLLHDYVEDASAGRSAVDPSLARGLARYRARWKQSFGYDNSTETFTSVLCSDSLNPSNPNAWKPAITRAERATPLFAPIWGWSSVPCAGSWWHADDEDAYRGTFDHATANPVLVVGNYWDPATNYSGAVAASTVMPNSFLLSSDSWGHTAYGSSPCVTEQVDRYLVHLELPARASCTGPQPFSSPLDGAVGVGGGATTEVPLPDRDGLPAIVPLVPEVAPGS